MNTILLVSSVAAFLIAVLGLWRPIEPLVRKIYPWVPLPVLIVGVLSILNQELRVTEFPHLLLGVRVGLDEIGRAFMLLTATAWFIAGLFSRKYFKGREQERLFRFYFLTTYSGTIGLTMAQDALAFYAGYALMTLGGYGLIIHSKKAAALVAGRVYIVVALIGEMMALAGLIIAGSSANTLSFQDVAIHVQNTPSSAWSFWLIFLGFGTKVGLVPLHFWLPRAYYWAPLPAVAVLSGAMTKAGVLGWLRFLAPSSSPNISIIILAAGALMAFYGVIFGLVQTRAKTTLAFSSLSQMGYLTIAFSTLHEPGANAVKSVSAIVAYAFHHGLTKVTLFLGLGVLARFAIGTRARRYILGALVICSLALIGFPLTGGAYAKYLLKESGAPDGFWHLVSGPLMTLGSIGTTLLMLRFLVLCYRQERDQVQPTSRFISWSSSFFFVLSGYWILPHLLSALSIEARGVLALSESFSSYVPVLIGSFIAIPLTYRIWIKDSHLTPRPFDTLMQGGYKAFWEDFPRELDAFVSWLTHGLARIQKQLQIERRAQRVVSFSQAVHTTWLLGCALMMGIGILVWAFLAGFER